jgi:hypothetical protein
MRTEDGLGSLDDFEVEFLVEFALSLEELDEYLMVDAVGWEELLVGEGARIGERDGVDLPVLGWVFQLHK